MTTATTEPDFVERALDAYAYDEEQRQARQRETDSADVRQVLHRMRECGIEPAGPSFRNHWTGKPIVPIIAGGSDRATETWTYAVGAAIHLSDVWVFAEDHDGYDHDRLYPVVKLTGLGDVGQAIQYGGSTPRRHLTIADVVEGKFDDAKRQIGGADPGDAYAIVLALQGVAFALADVSEAVRELKGGA